MDDESKQANRVKKNRLLLYTAIAAILVLIFIYYSENSLIFPKVDKQIAIMEAERFVPDEENAAIIYEQLLADFNDNDFNREITGIDIRGEEFSKGWKSEDYPQAARWLEGQEETIAKLLDACKRDKCYFPFEIDMELKMQRLSTLRQLARLLEFAAKNDVGEDRIEEAIEKNRCLLQTGKHLKEQFFLVEYMVGIAIEALSLSNLKMIILESDISQSQLEMIEHLPISTTSDWEGKSAELKKAEELYALKKTNAIAAIFMKKSFSETLEKIKAIDNRLLSDRRAIHIIIELKKYKEKEGNWPEGLEQIKGNLNAEFFIDPQNDSDFVYKPTDEGFTLYSKGPNNIDEGGDNQDPADDLLIWPKK